MEDSLIMADTKKKMNDAAEAKKNTSMTTAPKANTTTAATAVKTTAKPEEKKDETKNTAAQKTPAAGSKASKKTTRKAAKRGAKSAAERTIELQVQFDGKNDVTYTSLVNHVKAWWKSQGKRETSMKSLNIYVKPEDSMAYCVINDKINYDIDLSEWN